MGNLLRGSFVVGCLVLCASCSSNRGGGGSSSGRGNGNPPPSNPVCELRVSTANVRAAVISGLRIRTACQLTEEQFLGRL